MLYFGTKLKGKAGERAKREMIIGYFRDRFGRNLKQTEIDIVVELLCEADPPVQNRNDPRFEEVLRLLDARQQQGCLRNMLSCGRRRTQVQVRQEHDDAPKGTSGPEVRASCSTRLQIWSGLRPGQRPVYHVQPEGEGCTTLLISLIHSITVHHRVAQTTPSQAARRPSQP